MSKISNPRCELVSGEDVSNLEGKLKTFIDALADGSALESVNDKKNKATKDIVRLILWDWFNFITNHNTDHLLEKKDWYKENKISKKLASKN